jgi:hypothetical protein
MVDQAEKLFPYSLIPLICFLLHYVYERVLEALSRNEAVGPVLVESVDFASKQ